MPVNATVPGGHSRQGRVHRIRQFEQRGDQGRHHQGHGMRRDPAHRLRQLRARHAGPPQRRNGYSGDRRDLNNSISNNGGEGISTFNAVITGNEITDNEKEGIVSFAGTVSNNTISQNTDEGLFVPGSGGNPGTSVGYSNNSFRGNNGGGAQVFGGIQLGSNICDPLGRPRRCARSRVADSTKNGRDMGRCSSSCEDAGSPHPRHRLRPRAHLRSMAVFRRHARDAGGPQTFVRRQRPADRAHRWRRARISAYAGSSTGERSHQAVTASIVNCSNAAGFARARRCRRRPSIRRSALARSRSTRSMRSVSRASTSDASRPSASNVASPGSRNPSPTDRGPPRARGSRAGRADGGLALTRRIASLSQACRWAGRRASRSW